MARTIAAAAATTMEEARGIPAPYPDAHGANYTYYTCGTETSRYTHNAHNAHYTSFK